MADTATYNIKNYLVIDRIELLRNATRESVIDIIKNVEKCGCIRKDIKALVRETLHDPFIILDKKLMKKGIEKNKLNRIMSRLKEYSSIVNEEYIINIEDASIRDRLHYEISRTKTEHIAKAELDAELDAELGI